MLFVCLLLFLVRNATFVTSIAYVGVVCGWVLLTTCILREL
jgi:hypothetical protein